MNDGRHVALGDPVYLGERGDRPSICTTLPQFHDLGLGQFRFTVTRPLRSGLGMGRGPVSLSEGVASLRHHVGRVLGMGSQKEMTRPDAGANVAMVEHQHPVRDRTVVEFPREPMGALADDGKKFQAETSVTAELISQAEADVMPLVQRQLIAAVSGDLRGPRGGRYVAIEDPTVLALGQNADDFMRNTYTFRATVRAKYVRPK